MIFSWGFSAIQTKVDDSKGDESKCIVSRSGVWGQPIENTLTIYVNNNPALIFF